MGSLHDMDACKNLPCLAKNSVLLGISPIIKQALDAAYIICEFADTEYDRYLEYHLK